MVLEWLHEGEEWEMEEDKWEEEAEDILVEYVDFFCVSFYLVEGGLEVGRIYQLQPHLHH